MADEKTASTENLENLEKTKPTGKQRAKNICKRWWWLFFLIFAAIVLVIVLPIVYVAYPKIARDSVKDSRLSVNSLSIYIANSSAVSVSAEETLYTSSSHHPELYPFNASLYLLDGSGDTPFLSLEVDGLTAKNGATVNVPLQTVPVHHLEEYTKFVILVASSEEFSYSVRGSGDLKQGGLPKTSVNYNNTITQKGLNGLKGFTLDSIHLLNTTEADGTNAVANVTIPNASLITLNLGNVSVDLSSVNDTSIGNATLPNVVLKPGNNTVQMNAQIYELVAGAIALAQKSPILPVTIRGNRSVYHGEEIPWYTTMLQQTVLQSSINISQALA